MALTEITPRIKTSGGKGGFLGKIFGGVAGAVAGGVLGGPAGMVKGASLGSTAGGLIGGASDPLKQSEQRTLSPLQSRAEIDPETQIAALAESQKALVDVSEITAEEAQRLSDRMEQAKDALRQRLRIGRE